MRRTLGGLLARVGLAVVVFLVAAEILLWIGSAFLRDRSPGAWGGVQTRVLVVGDSHAYGAGVDEQETFPAHLQAWLDAAAPGHFGVANLGIPGLNTAQVRERLPVQVAAYDPDVVIVWCGVNNRWNRTDLRDSEPFLRRLGAFAQRSRVYRAVLVAIHDGALERAVGDLPTDGARPSAERLVEDGTATWTARTGASVETIRNEPGARSSQDEVEALAYRDYRGMATWLRSAGISMVLVAYPWPKSAFASANRAMDRVARELQVPLVVSAESLARVPPEQVRILGGVHPNGAVYREIGRDAAAIVMALTGDGS